MMNRSFLLGLPLAFSLVVACSSPSGESAGANDSDLTGSLANAKACAVRDGYTQAQLAAFKSIATSELPGGAMTPSSPAAVAKFEVASIGTIFVVEESSGAINFYDVSGIRIATARKDAAGGLAWSGNGAAALQCASAATSGDDDDDDDDTTSNADGGTSSAPTTCLSTDPIDATKYEYVKARAKQPSACTPRELSDFSAYYKAHASEDTLIDGWKTSVGAQCSSCIFSNAFETAWAPMTVSTDAQGAPTFSVNRGGCIEQVSGSTACGRSYQQFQDCLVDACLATCTTQAEFTACRQDTTVLTTSCKGAYDTLKTDCGEAAIGGYEMACKGTTYTFEGPIKVACINP